MVGKTSDLLLGLILVFWGIVTIFKRSYYSSKFMQTVDWGSGHTLIGSLMVGLGICLVYHTLGQTRK